MGRKTHVIACTEPISISQNLQATQRDRANESTRHGRCIRDGKAFSYGAGPHPTHPCSSEVQKDEQEKQSRKQESAMDTDP